ncbi:MAG: hypothetical protein NVS3B26_16400 [Mycobacteriales bacterium]
MAAAWEIAHADGLVAITMRDLGARVGMRAQSLYLYFPSKHAIYDAMFEAGNRELLTRIKAIDKSDPVALLRSHAHTFVQFCVEDPVRHQLLFQRTIPGFEPSAESYATAVEGLALTRAAVSSCGVRGARAFDVWTALIGGLASQQNANEPGGRRWVRLIDESTDMYLERYRTPKPRGTT